MNRRCHSHMRVKHRRWPLGTRVACRVPIDGAQVSVVGRVFKHDVETHGCTVEFPFVVDLGDANGARFCHVIPFRRLCRLPY